MSNKVTLHVEAFDMEMSERDARWYAERGPESFSAGDAYGKAVATAARKLYPEYRYQEGGWYKVTFKGRYSDETWTRVFRRVPGGWAPTAEKGYRFLDDGDNYYTVLSAVRMVEA